LKSLDKICFRDIDLSVCDTFICNEYPKMDEKEATTRAKKYIDKMETCLNVSYFEIIKK